MYLGKAYAHSNDVEPIAVAERVTSTSIRDWAGLVMRVDQRIGIVRIYRDGVLVESHAA